MFSFVSEEGKSFFFVININILFLGGASFCRLKFNKKNGKILVSVLLVGITFQLLPALHRPLVVMLVSVIFL